MGLTDSGLCSEAVWGLFFPQNWLPRVMVLLCQLAPCPSGWKLPSPQQYNRLCSGVAVPWLPFTIESIGLTCQRRKAWAKRAGCELVPSLRHGACQDSNALYHFSPLLGGGDLSLKLLHALRWSLRYLHLLAVKRPSTSATANIWCSSTDANGKPQTFDLLGSVRRAGHALQSFSYIREGGPYKTRKKNEVQYTPAQRLFKNLNWHIRRKVLWIK